MKKLVACVLTAAVSLTAASAFADSAVNTIADTQEISDTAVISPQFENAKYRSFIGEVKSLDNERITIDSEDAVFNISEDTQILDSSILPYTGLKEGDTVMVVCRSSSTKSLPPQYSAKYIVLADAENGMLPIFATVASNENGEILSDDGNYRFITSEKTNVTAFKIKIALRAEDITPGSEIFAFANLVGLSIPAYVVPDEIFVMSLASEPYEGVTEPDSIDIPLKDGKIPLREVFEKLGFTVTWSEADMGITISKDGTAYVRLQIGTPVFDNCVPVLIDDKTYIPAEFVASACGGLYSVDASENTLKVRTK